MKSAKVLLVEDEYNDVREVVQVLKAGKLMQVDHQVHYSRLGSSPVDFQNSVQDYDLLILDVLMRDRDDKPFIEFVNAIHGLKPFIAYTMLDGYKDVQLPSGPVELREWVFENGGIAVITKSFGGYSSAGRPSNRDMQFALLERILTFYWLSK